MLIPSIDLMGGRVVQLQQGERLMIESDDLGGWMRRFAKSPLVQVIDLDAAKGVGDNSVLVARVCAELPCQVGGGIRTPERAKAVLGAGAHKVILGSALFDEAGVAVDRVEAFARAIDSSQLVAAVDARGGQVAINGWRTVLPISPAEAIRALSPYVGAFLYTHVDTEGTLRGLDLDVVRELRAQTRRSFVAAGGIRSFDEVAALDRDGIDAVVGMAIYRGLITV